MQMGRMVERFATWRMTVAAFDWRRRLCGGTRLAAGAAGRTGPARRSGLVHTRRGGGPVRRSGPARRQRKGRLCDHRAHRRHALSGLVRPAIRRFCCSGSFEAGRRCIFYRWPSPLRMVLENTTIAALALSYDGEPSPLTWLAAAFTVVKTGLIVATLAAVGVGGTLWMWARIRQSR